MKIRALAVATIAVTAVLGLAGCRVEPGAAAFVGSTRITDQQVDQVNDEQVAVARERGREITTEAVASNRQFLVGRLTVAEVARRILAEQNIPVTEVSAADVAKENGRTEPNEIDEYIAQTRPYLDALRASVTPAPLTNDEKKEVTQNLVNLGAPPAAAAQFFTDPELQRGMAFRRAILAGADKYDVEVSPRYGQVAFPVWTVNSGGQPLNVMFVELGENNDAVKDRPRTEPLPA